MFRRISIESRENAELATTRKSLLTFRASHEKAVAMDTMYTERVERLRRELQKARETAPPKRAFDFVRFKRHNLETAIFDDLHQAEIDLFTNKSHLEHTKHEVAMLEEREARLVSSLAARAAAKPATDGAVVERALGMATYKNSVAVPDRAGHPSGGFPRAVAG